MSHSYRWHDVTLTHRTRCAVCNAELLGLARSESRPNGKGVSFVCVGHPLPADVTHPRFSMRKNLDAVMASTVPCSFCHASGFVGTSLCQECRGYGRV